MDLPQPLQAGDSEPTPVDASVEATAGVAVPEAVAAVVSSPGPTATELGELVLLMQRLASASSDAPAWFIVLLAGFLFVGLAAYSFRYRLQTLWPPLRPMPARPDMLPPQSTAATSASLAGPVELGAEVLERLEMAEEAPS